MNDAIRLILDLEGGYVHNPDDPGGETRWGISKRSYPNLDIANLSKADAAAIYQRDYYDPVAKHVDDPAMRLLVFDSCVQHGVARGLAWAREHPTFHAYLANRLRFYASLSTWEHFGKGWTRRVAAVVAAAGALSRSDGVREVDVLIDNRGGLARLVGAVRGRSGPTRYQERALANGEGRKLDIDSV